MKFWQKRRAKDSVEAPNSTDDLFDPAIWKDKQDVLQIFHISESTLARYRKNHPIRKKRFGKKMFYNIQDIYRLYKTEDIKVEEPPQAWPYSHLWTAVVGLDILFWIISKDLFEAILYMTVPLFIAVPAQIIMSIQKGRGRKKD
jgi:hypothetical protein